MIYKKIVIFFSRLSDFKFLTVTPNSCCKNDFECFVKGEDIFFNVSSYEMEGCLLYFKWKIEFKVVVFVVASVVVFILQIIISILMRILFCIKREYELLDEESLDSKVWIFLYFYLIIFTIRLPL